MKKQLGQFFTTRTSVRELMTSLIYNSPSTVLEPSSGAGHLVQSVKDKLPNCHIHAVEYDRTVPQVDHGEDIIYTDFFSFNPPVFYDLIIANPPYVAWKNTTSITRENAQIYKKRYSDKTNLYHLFIDKCADMLAVGGQMIFICPKEWLYSTSARPLRDKLYHNGAITHIIDGGESKVFDDANTSSIMIFRWVKGEILGKLKVLAGFSENTWVDKTLLYSSGSWSLRGSDLDYSRWKYTLGDIADIKVGIVSGADGIFNISNREDKGIFIAENTVKKYLTTKGTEYFIDVGHISRQFDIPEYTLGYLAEHKDALISRGIRKFDESNWWQYGAMRNVSLMESDRDRIFCYHRTRKPEPFFASDATYYSGGIIGIFLKDNCPVGREELLDILNGDTFRMIMSEAGLVNNGKVSLQPSTLKALPAPVG